MLDCRKRKLAPDAEDRIADAGVRNWPVKINVTRTETAFGITSTHHRVEGAELAFLLVGKPVRIDDELVETPEGIVRYIGVATAVLEAVEDTRLRKVA